MTFQHLTVLLPCYSLEDLNLDRPTAEAEQILAAWSALWHPALIAAAGQMPHWASANSPPSEPAGHLCVLPPCSEAMLPADWLVTAGQAGAGIIRNLTDRRQIVAAALELLGADAAGVEPSLAADFLALGFCHFVVEVLTRKLRYMSNLDEPGFESHTVAAAGLACQGDIEAARQRLQSAFDLLHNSREYAYPVEPRLLDLTLVASSTIGQSLRSILATGAPLNLLVAGQVIDEMARQEPASLQALREAVEKGAVSIIGGEYRERELTLLPPEAIYRNLQRGLAAYQRHLGMQPAIFGRRRFGLTPVLPQILEKLSFTGVLHATLDDGRFPSENQSRIHWEGLDGTSLEALASIPDDAGRADAFLRLPQRLGKALDADHNATLIFAHWPAGASPWYEDLRRIAVYTSVLGSFTLANDYFQQTSMAGQTADYKADQYRSPYLKQAVAAGQRDPLSRWVRYFQRRAAADAAETLDVLACLAGSGATAEAADLAAIQAEIEDMIDATSDADTLVDGQLREQLDALMRQLARALGSQQQTGANGFLVVNTSSFSRRLGLELPELAALPDVDEPIAAAGQSGGRNAVVVDVPAMGFARIVPGKAKDHAQSREGKERKWSLFGAKKQESAMVVQRPAGDKTAQETLLHNEFFTVVIDPHTGAIRSISDYRTRGPRLSQQLAVRLPSQGGDQPGDPYSIMAADEVKITAAGPVLGEVVARGRLMSREGKRLAGFQQTTRVWRGSRAIELLIELDAQHLPEADPWNSYYAARFAWPDEAANLYRSVNMATVPTEIAQFESPHFIDVRTAKTRTTLLTAGLPYHRRDGLRKLDTLLIVQGESCRRFRLGIGIDVPAPLPAALDMLSPPPLLAGAAPPRSSGWLFHLDVRSVVATHWELLSGGFRVRLLESEGRRVELNLRSFRAVRSAQKMGTADAAPTDLAVEGDRVAIDLRPYEWAEIEARW
jgi:alpha-mannosidase